MRIYKLITFIALFATTGIQANAAIIQYHFHSFDLTKVGETTPMPTWAVFALDSDAVNDFGAPAVALYQTEGPQVSVDMGSGKVHLGQGIIAAIEDLSTDSVTFMFDDGTTLVRIDLADQSNPLSLLSDDVTPLGLTALDLSHATLDNTIEVEMDGERYVGTIGDFSTMIVNVPEPTSATLSIAVLVAVLGIAPRFRR